MKVIKVNTLSIMHFTMMSRFRFINLYFIFREFINKIKNQKEKVILDIKTKEEYIKKVYKIFVYILFEYYKINKEKGLIIKEVDIYLHEDNSLIFPLTNDGNFTDLNEINRRCSFIRYANKETKIDINKELLIKSISLIKLKVSKLINGEYKSAIIFLINNDIVSNVDNINYFKNDNEDNIIKEIDYYNNITSHLICKVKIKKDKYKVELL